MIILLIYFYLSFFLISILNFIIFVRIEDSYSILNRIRKLEELNFPKYKYGEVGFIKKHLKTYYVIGKANKL